MLYDRRMGVRRTAARITRYVIPLGAVLSSSCGCPKKTFDRMRTPTYGDGGELVDPGLLDDAGCAALCLQGAEPLTDVASCTPLPFQGPQDVGGAHCVLQLPCEGRRPAELMRGESVARDAAGAWLATAAQLEAASVPAFEILARELNEHGAPPRLVGLATQAAEDERIHARLVGALGRQLGARPGPVAVRSSETRNLFAIALENAIEGLVREAHGARIGFEQANRAGLDQVRVAYRAIARDEARHAALAALVHSWIMPRLRPREQRLVAEARDRALDELVEQCAQEPPEALRDLLGLPEATRAVELAVLERA